MDQLFDLVQQQEAVLRGEPAPGSASGSWIFSMICSWILDHSAAPGSDVLPGHHGCTKIRPLVSSKRQKSESVQEGRGTRSNRLGTQSFHRVAVTHGSALSQLRSPLICSAHQLNLRRPSTSVGGRQEVTSAGPGGGVTECGSSLFDSHFTPRPLP